MFARVFWVLSTAFVICLAVPAAVDVMNVTSDASTGSAGFSGTCSFHASLRQYCIKSGSSWTEATSIKIPKLVGGDQSTPPSGIDGTTVNFYDPSWGNTYGWQFAEDKLLKISWYYPLNHGYITEDGRPKFDYSTNQETCPWNLRERSDCGSCTWPGWKSTALICFDEKQRGRERKMEIDCQFKC